MCFATNKILLLFFCAFFISSNAQNEFSTYTKTDGLTSSNISSVEVDKKGIIWVATSSGISAFTGDEWVSVKNISDNQGYRKNLGSVSLIFVAKNDDIWVSSNNGLFFFNGKFWTSFSGVDYDGFIVTDIFEDQHSRIWIMLERRRSLKDIADIGFSLVEGKVQMYNGRDMFNFLGLIGGSAAVVVGDPMEYFTSHIFDASGNLWITNLDGVYKYDGIGWTKFDDDHLPSEKCYKVLETSDNEIWVATLYGVSKLVDDKWIKYEKNRGIKGNLVYDLFEDNQNRLWAYTSKNNRFKVLCVFENDKWKPFFKENTKIKSYVSRLINYDNQLIAFSKKGISTYDGNSWTNLIKKQKIDDNTFTNLTVAKDKSLWFAGQKGIYNLNNNGIQKTYKPSISWRVTFVFESSNGDIWVGTEKSGVYKINNSEQINYTVGNGLADDYIKMVFEDRSKSIWVVTKGGISRLK